MTTQTTTPKTETVHKLAELIKDIRVAMMTTFTGENGKPHARPMYTQKLNPETFDGTLWFMTDRDSAKVDELAKNPSVLLTYAETGKNRYVAVMGQAEVERNEEVARELWSVHAKGWWPGGPDDPALVLIRVHVESAEYWDGPGKASYLFQLLKAVVKGERIQAEGEHGKLTS